MKENSIEISNFLILIYRYKKAPDILRTLMVWTLYCVFPYSEATNSKALSKGAFLFSGISKVSSPCEKTKLEVCTPVDKRT